MKSIPATRAREQLYRLIDEVAESSEPVRISGPRANVIVVSEDDWRSIQETLYLQSIPGMRESIIEGMNTPEEELVDEPDW